MKMATELTVKIPNRIGQLAAVAGALGEAGVNIATLSGAALGSKGIIHIVVADKDAARARRALKAAKIRLATDRKVIELRLANKPGSLARAARRLEKARVSVDSAYMLGAGKRSSTLALGVKDVRKANKALGR
jgi:hypothetical protein